MTNSRGTPPDAWRELGRLERAYGLAMLGFLGCILAAVCLAKFLPSHSDTIVVLGFVSLFPMLAITGALHLSLATWRCPRCKEPFLYSRQTGFWPSRRNCARCGVARGTKQANEDEC